MNPKLIAVQMIAAQRVEGKGTEDDPIRTVNQWFSTRGELLLEYTNYGDARNSYQALVELLIAAGDGKF